MTFTLARIRWPHAKIFSLTSGAAVMTMNSQLGYKPVTFGDLTDDEAFWRGCEGCINKDVLHRTNRKYCICTAMLFDPADHLPAKLPQEVIERIKRIEAPLPPSGGKNSTSTGNKENDKHITPTKGKEAFYRKPLYEKADGATYGKLKEFASENRKNPTQAESILWNLLKGKQLGVSFRRQHVIDQFIADFVCLSHHLVIEIDEGYHQLPEQQISDQERTQRLKELGMKVIRFTNEEIIGNTDMVINQIKNVLK